MLFFSNNQSFNLLFSQIFAKYFEILNLITYQMFDYFILCMKNTLFYHTIKSTSVYKSKEIYLDSDNFYINYINFYINII